MSDTTDLQSLYLDAFTGTFVSKNETEPGLCGISFQRTQVSDTWVIDHQKDIRFFLFSVYVDNIGSEEALVMPSLVKVLDSNTLLFEFDQPYTGTVNILYYVDDKNLCDVSEEDPIVFVFGGLNSYPINLSEINS